MGEETKKDQHPPLLYREDTGDGLGLGGRKKTKDSIPPSQWGSTLYLRGYVPPAANRKTDSILPFCNGKDAVRYYKRSTVVLRVFSAPAEAYGVPPVRDATTGGLPGSPGLLGQWPLLLFV